MKNIGRKYRFWETFGVFFLIFNWSCQCQVILKIVVVFLLPLYSVSLHTAYSFHIIRKPAEMRRTAFNLHPLVLCQFSKEYRRGAEFICFKFN